MMSNIARPLRKKPQCRTHVCVGVWVCGRVGAWVRGCVCGYVGEWVRVWVCGYVGMWVYVGVVVGVGVDVLSL